MDESTRRSTTKGVSPSVLGLTSVCASSNAMNTSTYMSEELLAQMPGLGYCRFLDNPSG
jgi:hypothetical protein